MELHCAGQSPFAEFSFCRQYPQMPPNHVCETPLNAARNQSADQGNPSLVHEMSLRADALEFPKESNSFPPAEDARQGVARTVGVVIQELLSRQEAGWILAIHVPKQR